MAAEPGPDAIEHWLADAQAYRSLLWLERADETMDPVLTLWRGGRRRAIIGLHMDSGRERFHYALRLAVGGFAAEAATLYLDQLARTVPDDACHRPGDLARLRDNGAADVQDLLSVVVGRRPSSPDELPTIEMRAVRYRMLRDEVGGRVMEFDDPYAPERARGLIYDFLVDALTDSPLVEMAATLVPEHVQDLLPQSRLDLATLRRLDEEGLVTMAILFDGTQACDTIRPDDETETNDDG